MITTISSILDTEMEEFKYIVNYSEIETLLLSVRDSLGMLL